MSYSHNNVCFFGRAMVINMSQKCASSTKIHVWCLDLLRLCHFHYQYWFFLIKRFVECRYHTIEYSFFFFFEGSYYWIFIDDGEKIEKIIKVLNESVIRSMYLEEAGKDKQEIVKQTFNVMWYGYLLILSNTSNSIWLITYAYFHGIIIWYLLQFISHVLV